MSDDQGPWGRLPPPAPQGRPPSGPRPLGARRLIIIGVCVVLGLGAAWLFDHFPQTLTGADWGYSAYAVGMLVIVMSALMSRRLKLGQMARYAAIWGAIVVVLLVGYTLRDDLAGLWPRLVSEIAPSHAVPTGARTLVLTQSDDGGYYLVGSVNGVPVRFLIDTGSSDIVLSLDDARRVDIDQSKLVFDHSYETANGIGKGAILLVSSVEAGPVRLGQTEVSVNEAPLSHSLLGMAFLKKLDFEFKGRQLILRSRAGA
jgi:aspartyl protease family protein